MARIGGYDGELQMFVDASRNPEQAHLEFLRWLAEHGRLEHPPVGAPGGDYADEDSAVAEAVSLTASAMARNPDRSTRTVPSLAGLARDAVMLDMRAGARSAQVAKPFRGGV